MRSTGKLVKPENMLKKKVGAGGFNDSDLVRAQQGIDNNKIDFRPLGLDLIKELDTAIADVTHGAYADKSDEQKFSVLMYPLMQLKSQGGLFQYPLVSRISHITLDFLENITSVDNDVVAIVAAYKKAVQAILTLEIKNETHPIAKQLLTEMDAVFTRYRKSRGIGS